MTIELSYDEALELLERAVAEKGEDYVYKKPVSCVYFYDATPSCIVGHVLAYEGVDEEEVVRVSANSGTVGVLEANGIIKVDDRTRRLLSKAQRLQDDGNTWGYAVRMARAQTPPFTP